MNKDVQRLREPGAWVLLGSVALQILSGLIGLLFGRGRLPFTIQAFDYVSADQFFTGVTVTGVAVIAVLLVTRLGGPPTRQARNIALGGLVILGIAGLLTVICMLAGLGAGSVSTGVLLDSALTAKVTMFLYGLSKLAVLGVGGYYILHVYQSFSPATQYGPQYPQQGWVSRARSRRTASRRSGSSRRPTASRRSSSSSTRSRVTCARRTALARTGSLASPSRVSRVSLSRVSRTRVSSRGRARRCRPCRSSRPRASPALRSPDLRRPARSPSSSRRLRATNWRASGPVPTAAVRPPRRRTTSPRTRCRTGRRRVTRTGRRSNHQRRKPPP